MYKTFILLCLASSLGCSTFAQTGYKTWSPNGLTWTDFAAHPDLTQSRMSWFAYLIGYKPHKTRLHDTIIQYPQAYGVMNQLDSWVKSEAKNQDMLFYNQTAFNLVELSTRKVQAEMNRTHYFNLAEIPEPKRGVIFSKTKYIFETQVEKAKQRMQQFEDQTQYGTNTAAVTLWAKQIQAELNELPMASVPNDLKIQKFRFGLFWAVVLAFCKAI